MTASYFQLQVISGEQYTLEVQVSAIVTAVVARPMLVQCCVCECFINEYIYYAHLDVCQRSVN